MLWGCVRTGGNCRRAAAPPSWQAIQDTIAQEDPLCRGVLLLGLAEPEAELIACFATAAPFAIVKGFAIGRTIFQDVARAWFAGAMSDARRLQGDGREFLEVGQCVARRAHGGCDMKTIRCTAAQAAVRYLANQYIDAASGEVRFFAGVWAIFGHGNVAGLGEALHAAREQLPTHRAHNEQAMAHAAIAFAKQLRRRRAMICTSSIGPGATNMVTAAALAHANRLPVLFLPGDVFASRGPDPVLQQIESFSDGTVSANDCFKAVSRYFDRIARPEQLIDALPHAMNTLAGSRLVRSGDPGFLSGCAGRGV